ncbi:transposase [Facklamia sp. P12950]|uniref:transposase n=1 Tax=Facklamia sp. P12950 TaxID=3421951 RepID=UPI003D17956D
MAKYRLEIKINIVSEYLSGTIGINALAKKYKLKSTQQLRRWIHAYKTLGIKGLERSRKQKTYSVNFKLRAITMYEASEKSYQDVANELGLNNPALITRWRQEYHDHGMEGLSRKPGRPPMSNKEKVKRENKLLLKPLR